MSKVPAIPTLERPLTLVEIRDIEARYREARAESDISALTILAVEAFPALIATAKKGPNP
jgi:hypothetical protein